MNAINRVDDFLLRKVFTPVAHYIDYRFHKNTYDVARWMIQLAAVLALLHPVASYALNRGWPLHVFEMAVGLLAAGILCIWIIRLSEISQSYEKRPDILPTGTIVFLTLGGGLRLLFLGLPLFSMIVEGLTLQPHNYLFHIADSITSNWLMAAGYFACVPKPPAKRKRQEQGIGFLTPVALRN